MDLGTWLKENTYAEFIKKEGNKKHYFSGNLTDAIFAGETHERTIIYDIVLPEYEPPFFTK